MTSRMLRLFWFPLLVTLACVALFRPITLTDNQVHVRHVEGLMPGFLALRTLTSRSVESLV
jgi:hypothetical protein